MSGWIDARECKPESRANVLCYANDIVSAWCEVLYWNGVRWRDINGDEYDCIVTHWMNLPELPKY